jgi:hypothetical protein
MASGSIPVWEPLGSPPFWFVLAPGEDAPHMHMSLDSASAEADALARLYVGQTIAIYQLKDRQ